MYSLFERCGDWFQSDSIHPNKIGAYYLAQTVAQTIVGPPTKTTLTIRSQQKVKINQSRGGLVVSNFKETPCQIKIIKPNGQEIAKQTIPENTTRNIPISLAEGAYVLLWQTSESAHSQEVFFKK